MHIADRNMLSELGAMGSTLFIVNLSAGGPLSGLWQFLAALALGGNRACCCPSDNRTRAAGEAASVSQRGTFSQA